MLFWQNASTPDARAIGVDQKQKGATLHAAYQVQRSQLGQSLDGLEELRENNTSHELRSGHGRTEQQIGP